MKRALFARGKKVTLVFPGKAQYTVWGDRMRILFEDSHLLVCEKPAGVISEEGGMPELLREAAGCPEVYCVHRLDRETGGLMVYAKTRAAAAGLSKAIAEGKLEKEYLAVVQGQPESAGIYRDLLYRDAGKNKSYVVKRQRRGVREAELSYRLLDSQDGLSLVRIRLETGRSHQIRVQFASRKQPLVGDKKYGSNYREAGLALWSARLAFPHPVTGQALSFELPPPKAWPWTLFLSTAL